MSPERGDDVVYVVVEVLRQGQGVVVAACAGFTEDFLQSRCKVRVLIEAYIPVVSEASVSQLEIMEIIERNKVTRSQNKDQNIPSLSLCSS